LPIQGLMSSPNVQKNIEFGKLPELVYDVTRAVHEVTSKPLIVKLTPNVSDIVPLVLAAQRAGADAVTLINTVYGLAVDYKTRLPKLGNIIGGLSGPCIKPIALYHIYRASCACDIPIIGCGGITSFEDALEFFIVGAHAIQIGTMNFVNPSLGVDIIQKLDNYLKENNYQSIYSIIKSRKF